MIHILTLSWNGLNKLESLKPGLYRNLDSTGLDYKWLIRDNGSTDKTVETVQDWADVQLLAVNHNRDNFAQGMNSLADLAKSSGLNVNEDLILLLNNDVEFADDVSLSKMVKLMNKTGAGVVGCRLLFNDSNKLQHAGTIFGDRYNRLPFHYRHHETSDTAAEKNRYFQAVTAAVSLVRASDFFEVGGFHLGFHWAFDDVDLNLRIGGLGRKIVYCGETKIYHEESGSLKKNNLNKLFMNHNVQLFKSKWLGKYEIDHDRYLKDPAYNEIK